MKDKNYKERSNYQLDEWVKGNPIHNDIDDECCPDFSCCNPSNMQPEDIRETFKAAHNQGKEEVTMGMLMSFLGAALSTENIHIAGQAQAELN